MLLSYFTQQIEIAVIISKKRQRARKRHMMQDLPEELLLQVSQTCESLFLTPILPRPRDMPSPFSSAYPHYTLLGSQLRLGVLVLEFERSMPRSVGFQQLADYRAG